MTECAACGSAELRDNWQSDGVHLWQCKDCTARFSEARKVMVSISCLPSVETPTLAPEFPNSEQDSEQLFDQLLTLA